VQEFLESIQYSEFGLWVAGGDTIFAYPTILALHTLGLGIVVGMSAMIDCRVLGLARSVPLVDLDRLFRVMWWGFALNATTGVVLFIAAAADKAYQEIFYVKLAFIALALMTASRIRRTVFGGTTDLNRPMPQNAKALAVASLFLWMGAIVAGRLMAYTQTF
jgi:subtilisin family serine protease